MVKLYRSIPESQPWYWGQSFNWLVYKVFWWLYFSLAINLLFCIIRFVEPWNLKEAIHQISYVPDCKEQDESHPHFIFHYKLFLKLPYTGKLVNLNYVLKISPQSHHNWDYIPISQWHTFEDSTYFHISAPHVYYILLKEILLWQNNKLNMTK